MKDKDRDQQKGKYAKEKINKYTVNSPRRQSE